ncbi:MAG: phosphoenolpyruvate--protein phosphotransferase [Gemmatimonadota bacterium]|nr:MAG: phosphoenolpyruvate--protein phosphotransferase [Gemmatimonadota bacterium]
MRRKRLLAGIGVSPGVAVGPVYVLHTELPEITHRTILREEAEAEVHRLHQAVATVSEELAGLRDRTRRRAGAEEAKIFTAQIAMLEDEALLGEVRRLIRENLLTAERAFEFEVLELRELWAQSSSATLQQRTADLVQIQTRVLQTLLGQSLEDVLHNAGDRPAIVLARELTPGLTVQLEQALVTGLASEYGTRTSHAAILSRSLGMPCVMGLVGGIGSVQSGSIVILDGTRGTMLVDPTGDEIREAYEREGLRLELDRELEAVVGLPAVSRDGVEVTLRGNVDLPEEIESAADHGAEGVGLLRTEFLVVGRTELPGEDEQAEFYKRVGERFTERPVVVRSYDLGGDKFPASFRAGRQKNPFLGWRAIRVCLDHPDILRTQIRALLRARATSDVRLMLPLVTQVEEVRRTREILEESIAALNSLGIPIGADLPVGVMIETPAAAMMVEQLAECSNFISVGTNDLTQYTLAVDRGNPRLADRFTPLHPAVVRLLKRIVDCGVCRGIDVSVCGEMASEPMSTLLLLGLGYRVLSASPGALPLIRWIVRQIDISVAQLAAEQAIVAATTAEVTSVLAEHMGQYVDLDLLEAGRLPVV